MAGAGDRQAQDRRFMTAAIRLSRRHLALTGTNPAVATLIVRNDGDGPKIVGRGVTAVGGRPHAEAQALAEAGDRAQGATAYVTLEPCAHHGRTPPCAGALVTAGVTRVVGAASDPDPRVSGRGYAILRAAGIAVTERVLDAEARDAMAGYLIRSVSKRPEVVLKLAVSRDGKIGRGGQGQVAITGELARRMVHMLRAEVDAVLVGVGTAVEDDPELTVRLPGLARRSPTRIVLDPNLRLPVASKLVTGALSVPLLVAATCDADPIARAALEQAGAKFLPVETVKGRAALPEMLEDLAATGISRVLVEGGAVTARHFLSEDLVDRIALFTGDVEIGEGVASPLSEAHMPAGFRRTRDEHFGGDRYSEWVRGF